MTVERETWRALGTGVHVLVTDGDIAAATAAVRAVLSEVDLAYSRFRPDSELSLINAYGGRTRGLRPPPPPPPATTPPAPGPAGGGGGPPPRPAARGGRPA